MGIVPLDDRSDTYQVNKVRGPLEEDADNRISDLQGWQVGEHASAAIVSLAMHYSRPIKYYQLAHKLKHATIE